MLQNLVAEALRNPRVIPDIEVELKLIMSNPSRSSGETSFEKLYEIDMNYQQIENPNLKSFKLKFKHTLCQYGEFLIRKELGHKLKGYPNSNGFDENEDFSHLQEKKYAVKSTHLAIYFLLCEDLIKIYLEDQNILFEETNKSIEATLKLIQDVLEGTPLSKLIKSKVSSSESNADNLNSNSQSQNNSFFHQRFGDIEEYKEEALQISDLFSFGIFQAENILEPAELKNLIYYLCTSFKLLCRHHTQAFKANQEKRLQKISSFLVQTSQFCTLLCSKSCLKLILSSLYLVAFEIYQSSSENSIPHSESLALECSKDSIFHCELIKHFFNYIKSTCEADQDPELTSMLKKIQKISVKGVLFLSELYLSIKNFEKARMSIEFCFQTVSDESIEQLNCSISLFKYYLMLNKNEDVLNISTLIDHPMLDAEIIAILLSITIKYKKCSVGVLLGRSIFKLQNIEKILSVEKSREKCIILFLENLSGLLKMELKESKESEIENHQEEENPDKNRDTDELLKSSLNSISLQNSFEDIITLSCLTLDCLKCCWDVCKISYQNNRYLLCQTCSLQIITKMNDMNQDFKEHIPRRLSEESGFQLSNIESEMVNESSLKELNSKIYVNLLQLYIESSFKLHDIEKAEPIIEKLFSLYPNNSNCFFLKIKYELLKCQPDMQQKILVLLNRMVELEDFHIGYIVILLYEGQDLTDIKGKEAISEFMLNYLMLQDTNLSKLQEVLDKNLKKTLVENKAKNSKSTLTFLSIFINLYHYCSERNELRNSSSSKYFSNILPVINNFIERILNSTKKSEQDKMLRTFALCEEAIWLLGYCWNEGYSLIQTNPKQSIKYLSTASNCSLLSVKLMDLSKESQEGYPAIDGKEKDFEFMKKRFLYFYNAACSLLSSISLKFQLLTEKSDSQNLTDSLIIEINNGVVQKATSLLKLLDKSILSQDQLNNISFALEIKIQKWYKDLINECKDLYTSAFLLLLDSSSYVLQASSFKNSDVLTSEQIHQMLTDFFNSKIVKPTPEVFISVYTILESHGQKDGCMQTLERLCAVLKEARDGEAVEKLPPSAAKNSIKCYQKLIELTLSDFSLNSSVTYMKTLIDLLERNAHDDQICQVVEDALLFLISCSWNAGVEEYDNERDSNAKDLFLVVSSVVKLSEDIIRSHPSKYTRLDSYLKKWKEIQDIKDFY
ncbi:unnamed protein product [Moneuplotes crassus]|uniref:Uncharacterized protein n=1 Tax=Euplotes crassus TaxID=5936 RepID=A0AAD1UKK6_EUPCR|nr:unnamed protein product [Moneuplotes crassus]